MRPRNAWMERVSLGLTLGLLLVVGCGQRRSMGPGSSSGVLPDQEVSDFVLTETDKGTPQWTLYAQYAATYTARNSIDARGIRVDFYDEHGVKNSTLTSREGEINQLTRNMTAKGSVVLQNIDGTRMSTEHLQFLNQQQKIETDDFVRVERAGDVLTGTGFQSDPQLRHFEFRSQVNATVRTKSGELIPRGDRK